MYSLCRQWLGLIVLARHIHMDVGCPPVDFFHGLVCQKRGPHRVCTSTAQMHFWTSFTCMIVCWLVAECLSNMLVYFRDGSALTSVRAATLRQKLHIQLLQYTGPGITSPSADPITPCTWLCSHWSAKF